MKGQHAPVESATPPASWQDEMRLIFRDEAQQVNLALEANIVEVVTTV